MRIMLILILLAYSAVSDATGLSRKETVPDFASLCPFSNFCETSSPLENSTLKDVSSCCQKCSCDSRCYTVGTCCPGVEHLVPKTFESVTPQYNCSYPKQLLTSARNVTVSYNSGLKYRIVDSCPDKNKSEQFPNCDNPKVVRDYVIVSDVSNDYVYKNKHCAACNDAFDTTDWTLHISSCIELMMTSFKSIRDRNDYIVKHCEFDASPPDTINVETATCYKDRDIVSKCNVSKKWDVYDKALEEACLEERPTQNTIFEGDTLSSVVFFINAYQKYSNVYCYLCNIKNSHHQEVKQNVCESEESIGEKGVPFTSFSAILDLRDHTSDDPVNKESPCSSLDIWDHIADLCRPLKCPIGSMPVYGSCVNFAMSTTGYSLIVVFDLVFNQGNLTLLSDGWLMLVDRIVKIIQGECGYCKTGLFHINNRSTLTYRLSIELFTTPQCSATQVFERVKSLIMEGTHILKFRFVNNSFKISLSVAIGNLTKMEPIIEYQWIKLHCLGEPLLIQMQHLQTCPRLIIPKEELHDLGFKNSSIKPTHDMTIIVDNTQNMVSICVRKYFELWQSMTKSTAGISPPNIVVVIIVSLCSSVCRLT